METTVHNGTVSVDALSVCKGKHGASAKEGPWGHGFISWCQGKGINKIKVCPSKMHDHCPSSFAGVAYPASLESLSCNAISSCLP